MQPKEACHSFGIAAGTYRMHLSETIRLIKPTLHQALRKMNIAQEVEPG